MKSLTEWRPASSGTTSQTSGDILTQASDNLITQTGDTLILTTTLVSTPLATSWTNPAIINTLWRPGDSGTTNTDNASVGRTTEAGDTRITESGDTRVLNESVVSGKPVTIWTDN